MYKAWIRNKTLEIQFYRKGVKETFNHLNTNLTTDGANSS